MIKKKTLHHGSSTVLEVLTVDLGRHNIPQLNSEWLPQKYQHTVRANDQEVTDCGYQVPVMKEQGLNIFCDYFVMSQKWHLNQILAGQREKSQRAEEPKLGCRTRRLTLASVVPIDLVDRIRSSTMWYLKAIPYLPFPSVLTMLVYLWLYFLSIHYMDMRFFPLYVLFYIHVSI